MKFEIEIAEEQIAESCQKIVNECVDGLAKKQTGYEFRQKVSRQLQDFVSERIDEAIAKVLKDRSIVEDEVKAALKRKITTRLTKLMKE